ncbi:molybdenum cofactor biosynthesis protein MoaE [Ascidiaceihabitans sp.]|uniref:molybdenum cofactor biosynthesis protein MoaE n=1 Tax=Ascidiaceihabitans sp. TaxID=1872644 RepID=UPI0032993CCF
MRILVQEDPFDVGEEVSRFSAGHQDVGAVVTFTGVVRDVPEERLKVMEIEHYPGMTESALAEMAARAMDRWSLADALVIHRYGRLAPGEMIMMVGTASKHRKDAFEAAEYLMDFLKSRAPFWKREITARSAQWVAAKDDDENALKRW